MQPPSLILILLQNRLDIALFLEYLECLGQKL